MLVQPTSKWLSSIAVPNCGIISKPRNSETANVSEAVGQWLIESGFAVASEVLSGSKELSSSDVPPPVDPPKPKKSKSSAVNPETDS
jgi:hypothetical protein